MTPARRALLDEMKALGTDQTNNASLHLNRVTILMGQLLSDLSDEAEQISLRNLAIAEDGLRVQRTITRLTWALLVLTAALFALTVYLCQDTYQKSHANQFQNQSATQ